MSRQRNDRRQNKQRRNRDQQRPQQQRRQPKTVIDYLTEGWDEQQERIDAGVNRDFLPQNIITPFYPQNSQRKFLDNFFGRKHTDMMSKIIALADLGLIDNKCPSLEHPERKYTRIDPYTGTQYCTYGDKAYQDTLNDPLASEKQCGPHETSVISQGKYTCVDQILRGEFNCPNPERPGDTKLVRLPDGTGICVPRNSSFDNGDLTGLSLGNEQFDINRLKRFLELYREMDFKRRKSINNLNGIFKMYNPTTLHEKLSQSRFMRSLADEIHGKEDVEMANIGLYLHARSLNIIPQTFGKWNSFFSFNQQRPMQVLSPMMSFLLS